MNESTSVTEMKNIICYSILMKHVKNFIDVINKKISILKLYNYAFLSIQK